MNQISTFLKFLKHEKRYSDHTVNAYRIDLSQFDQYSNVIYEIQDHADIDFQMVRSWLVYLVENTYSPKSVNRKLSTVKTYFKFLLKKKLINENPASKVIAPKVSKKLPVYLEEIDLHHLFKTIEFSNDFMGAQEKLILELFYSLGIRLSELVNIQLKDIDRSNSQLKVLGKGKKERILPMHNQLMEFINEYISKRSSEYPNSKHQVLFVRKNGEPIYARMVQRIVKKNIEKVSTITHKSPHVLRHTFATHLSRHGADLNAIKELLGHTSLASTQVYTHNNIEQLKNVYKKSHPKA